MACQMLPGVDKDIKDIKNIKGSRLMALSGFPLTPDPSPPQRGRGEKEGPSTPSTGARELAQQAGTGPEGAATL